MKTENRRPRVVPLSLSQSSTIVKKAGEKKWPREILEVSSAFFGFSGGHFFSRFSLVSRTINGLISERFLSRHALRTKRNRFKYELSGSGFLSCVTHDGLIESGGTEN